MLLFLDDIGIKDLQTIYNNEKPALGIKCYVIEHIQNLDKILVDLKQVGIIIANAKSQFCGADVKIIEYICDIKRCHPNIFKILKILNWPKCTKITLAHAFMGVCIYYQIWIKNFAQVASPIYHVFKKNALFIWGKKQIKAMDLLKCALTTLPTLVLFDYTEKIGDIIITVNASLKG